MKCQNCGADIPDGANKCEFCGSQITVEMQKEREQLNKSQCPKCGSTNISFNREKKGEVKGKKTTKIVRSTVGVCKDCGYTWEVKEPTAPKRKTWLWVLGWIFIFPLPLMLILLKTKKVKPVLKWIFIVLAWAVYLIIAIASARSEDKSNTQTTQIESNVSQEETTQIESNVSQEETEPEVPIEYRNALRKAKSYSDTLHMSKQGIYDQLVSEYGENFPPEAAQYAIDNLVADYNANALEKAKSYQDIMAMSTASIYDQLVSEYGEKFTAEEAQYAIDHLND